MLGYIKNVGRSVKYALPQIVKNQIPSVAALLAQATGDSSQLGAQDTFAEIRRIVKDDVFGLMRTGLDNAKNELKTGKLYQTSEEAAASMDSQFGGDFGFDTGGDSDLDALMDATDGGGNSDSSPQVMAAAVATGAAAGVESLAASFNSSPMMRATAEAGIANARYGRAQLGASVAIGNALHGAISANSSALVAMHKFQTDVQQAFYRESLVAQTAQAGLLSEAVSRLGDIRTGQHGVLASADQLMAAYSGKESHFERIFQAEGGFDLGAYLGLITKRVKGAVSDGSMFSSVGRSIANAPITEALKMALEGAIPKDLRKQLASFNSFIGDLGVVLNERMRTAGTRLAGKGLAGTAASKVLGFLSVDPGTRGERPDMSEIVRNKAVAFDGYAHRSIVEVIPSYLADIHSELVAMRRGSGFGEPTDRKLYDMKTGQFTSHAKYKREKMAEADRAGSTELMDLREMIGDDGTAKGAQGVEDTLKLLREKRYSFKRGATGASFAEDLKSHARSMRADGKNDAADSIESAIERFTKTFDKLGATFAYRMTGGLERSRAARAASLQKVIGEEGAARQVFSGDMLDNNGVAYGLEDAKSVGAPAGPTPPSGPALPTRNARGIRHGGLRTPVVETAPAPSAGPERRDAAFIYGDRSDDGYSAAQRLGAGSAFHDAEGELTWKSLLQAPAKLISRGAASAERGISAALFGSSPAKEGEAEKIGLFSRMKKAMFGSDNWGDGPDSGPDDGGFFGRIMRAFAGAKATAKSFMFGSGVGEERLGIITRVRSRFDATAKRFSDYMFGMKDEKTAMRSGGVFGKVRAKFNSAAESVKSYMFGAQKLADDGFGNMIPTGDREGGVLGKVRDRFNAAVADVSAFMRTRVFDPAVKTLFGEKGPNGKRAGGFFGSTFQSGKDFFSQLADSFKTKVFGPVKQAFFGAGETITDAAGNVTARVGRGFFPKMMDTVKSTVIGPMMTSLFGDKVKSGVDADGNPVFKRMGGAVGSLMTAVKGAFAPLREAILGKDGVWPALKLGVSSALSDMKTAFFGKNPKTFSERIQGAMEKFGQFVADKMAPVTDSIKRAGDWITSKVVEPFGRFLSDPHTGLITKMSAKMTSVFDSVGARLFGEKESFTDDFGNVIYTGKRKGGLFGSITSGINRFFHGDPEKGMPGFVDRVVMPVKGFLHDEIWEPLTRNVTDMWTKGKAFFAREILSPLKGVFEPFVVEAKEQWRLMKDWVTGPLGDAFKGVGAALNSSVKDAFGASLSDMLRNNVLNPIKDALGSVKKFFMTALGSVLKLPVNVLKGVSDELKISQIRRGVGGYLAPEERERLLAKGKLDPSMVPAGSGSSIPKAAAAVAPKEAVADPIAKKKTFGEKLRERFSSVKDAAPAADVKASTDVVKATPTVAHAAAKVTTADVKAGPTDVVKAGPTVAHAADKTVTKTESSASTANVAAAASKPADTHSRLKAVPPADVSMAKTATAAQATADNTHNLYQFARKHLNGLGKNVERIVKHFKIKDTIVGANADKETGGFFNKLKRFATNPLQAMSGLVTGVFDGLRKGISGVMSKATSLLTLPFKLLGKGLKGLNSLVGGLRDSIGNIVGALADGALGAAKFILEGVSTVVTEGVKALSSVVSSIAKAIPDVMGALSSAAVGILKAGGQLVKGVAEVAGSLAVTLVKVGGEMIRTAASVAKSVVTSLAKVTFGAMGAAMKLLRGGAIGQKMGAFTPVFVTGGYLAGTEGGATSMTTAMAGLGGRGARMAKAAAGAAAGSVTGVGAIVGAAAGFFSPELSQAVMDGKVSVSKAMARSKGVMKQSFDRAQSMFGMAKAHTADAAGVVSQVKSTVVTATETVAKDVGVAKNTGFAAIKTRIAAAREAVAKVKHDARALAAAEGTQKHLGGIRSGFGKFSSMMMMAIPAVVMGIKKVGELFAGGKAAATATGALADYAKTKGESVLERKHPDIEGTATEIRGGSESAVKPTEKTVAQPTNGKQTKSEKRKSRKAAAKAKSSVGAVEHAVTELAPAAPAAPVTSTSHAAPTPKKGIGGMLKIGGLMAAGQVAGVVANDLGDQVGGGAGRAIKTAGKAAEYASMGMMFGPQGALIGAGIGAVVANLDLVSDGLSGLWNATKSMGNSLASGTKTLWEGLFGKDFAVGEDGEVTQKSEHGLMTHLWSSIFGENAQALKDGQVVRDGKLGLVGNMNNLTRNLSGALGKFISGEDVSIEDFVKGTTFDGMWGRMTKTWDDFGNSISGVVKSLGDGLKYITEFKFVDDIKSGIKSWWNGDKGTYDEKKEGDTTSLRQRIGGFFKDIGSSNRSEIKTDTVDNSGTVIPSRAFGGPLDKKATLVGELGPEVLDGRGNVISGAKVGTSFQNPALVKAASSREDGLHGTMQSSEKNMFYTASLLASINARLGGKPVKELSGNRDSTFDPKGDSPVVKINQKDNSIGSRVAAIGSSLVEGAKAVGGAVVDGVKNVGGAVASGASKIVEGAKSGGLSGAVSAAGSAVSGVASAVGSAAGGVVSAVKSAGSGVASAATSNLGAKAAVAKSLPGLGITDPNEQAMFMSQLDHESGGFKVKEENLNYKPATLLKVFPKYFSSAEAASAAAQGGPQVIANRVYGGRMGNKEAGDGYKYRGRGYIQLTGKDNYAAASKAIGVDLLSNPDLAAEHDTAVKVAAWFWKSKKIGPMAAAGDVTAVTKRINGGTHGLEDRKSKFGTYLAAIKSGQLATAMTGGWMSDTPTLVGEREPEVLTPDGKIHRSVDSFMTSSSADVTGLAVNTAVKEAARRSGNGPDESGAAEAIGKAMSALQAGNGGADNSALLQKMIELLGSIVANTGKALEQQPSAPVATPSQSNDSGGSIFTMNAPRGNQSAGGMGMSHTMQRILAG